MHKPLINCVAVITLWLMLPIQTMADDPATVPNQVGGKAMTLPSAPQKLITISKATTYYTEPLDEHGFVDFLAAINAELSRGVRTENNAAVLYFQATGQSTENPQLREKMCKLLGVAVPVERKYERDLLTYLLKKSELLGMNSIEGREWAYAQMSPLEQPWRSTDHPDAKAFLDPYQPTFELFRAARGKSEYWMPYATGDEQQRQFQLMNTLLVEVQDMRGCAQALNLKVMMELGAADFHTAQDDLLTLKALSRNVSRGATLIELLVAYSINRMTMKTENEFANRCPDIKILTDYQAQLKKLPSARTMSHAIDKFERIMSIDLICSLAHHEFGCATEDEVKESLLQVDELPNSMLLKMNLNWDVVLKIINHNFDRLLADSNLPSKERNEKHLQLSEELEQYKHEFLEPETVFWNLLSRTIRSENVGKVIAASTISSVAHAFTAEDQNHMRNQLCEACVALNIYKLKEGSYPTSLADLSPKYLKDIPTDIFADAPLKYSSNGKDFMLYSVGRNCKDDGGKSSDEDVNADDLVVKKK